MSNRVVKKPKLTGESGCESDFLGSYSSYGGPAGQLPEASQDSLMDLEAENPEKDG